MKKNNRCAVCGGIGSSKRVLDLEFIVCSCHGREVSERISMITNFTNRLSSRMIEKAINGYLKDKRKLSEVKKDIRKEAADELVDFLVYTSYMGRGVE